MLGKWWTITDGNKIDLHNKSKQENQKAIIAISKPNQSKKVDQKRSKKETTRVMESKD